VEKLVGILGALVGIGVTAWLTLMPTPPTALLANSHPSGLHDNRTPATALVSPGPWSANAPATPTDPLDQTPVPLLRSPASISGRLLTWGGGPLEGTVYLISMRTPLVCERQCRSDKATGEFILEDVDIGTYSLLARADHGHIDTLPPVKIGKGHQLKGLTFHLSQSVLLRIRSRTGEDGLFALNHDNIWNGEGTFGGTEFTEEVLLPGRTQIYYTAGGGGVIEVDAEAGEVIELVVPTEG